MKIVDANIVLRYLLNDVKELADKAAFVIEHESVLIPVEIIAEIVYVLEKVYKTDRGNISASLTGLAKYDNISVAEPAVVSSALKYYANFNLDFVDCLLLSYCRVKDYEIETFDDKLRKLTEKISNHK